MYSRNQTPTPSRTSPVGGRRGCLCKDGTYNSKCCNGDLQNQGIGSLTGGTELTQYLAQEDDNLILQENNSNIII
jgi:hypothetical protein